LEETQGTVTLDAHQGRRFDWIASCPCLTPSAGRQPLAWPVHYPVWIGLSQLLWIMAFAGFVWQIQPVC
jgi:hypothetical protein